MEICTFMTSPKVVKTVYFGYIWVPMGMLEPRDMVGRFVANMDPGGCSGAPVMAIFVSHVVLIFLRLDILKCTKVYEGIWRYMKVYETYLRYMEVI